MARLPTQDADRTTAGRGGVRVLRWTARGLLVVSAVAALLAGGLWVRSYFGGGETITMVGRRGVEVVSVDGRLDIETYDGWPAERPWTWNPGTARWRDDGPGEFALATQAGGGTSWGPFGAGKGYSRYGQYARADRALGGTFRLPPDEVFEVTHRWFRFPHWFAVTLFGLPPALWVAGPVRRRWVRRRRERAGCCVACGYDLRGSAGTGRCPECGRAF